MFSTGLKIIYTDETESEVSLHITTIFFYQSNLGLVSGHATLEARARCDTKVERMSPTVRPSERMKNLKFRPTINFCIDFTGVLGGLGNG
jgi:hypothetical protein